MLQQIIAIIIIAWLAERIYGQYRKNLIGRNEFLLWCLFWGLAAFAVIFIKKIDALLGQLGFSATGINFLLYVAIVVLFYLIFRLRLRLEKAEKILTKLVREDAIKELKK